MNTLPVSTPDGTFHASYSERGLTRLAFPGDAATDTVSAAPAPALLRNWHRLTTRAVHAILQGHPVPASPPLDLTAGTKFQRQVWTALTKVRPGQTLSYSLLARKIGHPKAARAVGGACGANPIPLLVPCHRVLAQGGKLGGFSGGLDWKRRLLSREGVG